MRDISLDPLLLDFISPLETKGFIIGGKEPIGLTSCRNRWKQIRKAVDIKGVTLHVFRPSYLTYAAGESSDIKSLQKIAGHSDIRMIMNRYVHAQPEKIKAVSAKVHDLLAG